VQYHLGKVSAAGCMAPAQSKKSDRVVAACTAAVPVALSQVDCPFVDPAIQKKIVHVAAACTVVEPAVPS
jgi:hypothetical protein